MHAFDVALHCLTELQEIEREDLESVSEGERRWRVCVGDVEPIRFFWDTAHGNELSLHDPEDVILPA